MEFRLFCTKRYYTKLMQKLFKKKFKKVLELNGAKIEPEYSQKKRKAEYKWEMPEDLAR